jgi:death-on-curing protein
LDGEPIWLTFEDVSAIHQQQLDLYGGLPGVRDAGLIESALANPKNKHHYEGEEDSLALAIGLWLSLARNHGFSDGNKRTSTVAMIEFLARNGYDLHVPDTDDHPLLGKLLESAIESSLDEYELYEILIHYVTERP